MTQPTVHYDNVSRPAHYTAYPVEVIELTEHMNFNRGNMVKYAARAGLKNPGTEIEDLEKAVWYGQREIERLRKKETEAKFAEFDLSTEQAHAIQNKINEAYERLHDLDDVLEELDLDDEPEYEDFGERLDPRVLARRRPAKPYYVSESVPPSTGAIAWDPLAFDVR